MSHPAPVKPTHKAIQSYYRDLQEYGTQKVVHEGALETAFSRLLADTARTHGWMLIPKYELKVGGKRIVPDGALRDEFNLLRGYWEAKDTHDDLDDEIGKKRGKGYPLTNTIFEDTRQAVLFQNGVEANRFDLTNAQQLADLLTAFYAYTEPDIEGFEQAVTEFKERVPDLAKGLADKIKAAHRDNPKFQKAFDGFYTLCQQTLNPNIRVEAVDEMLVQHLLTERLFRTIFDDEEFTRRNVIAAEVETVIDALVSQSFSRKDFLKSLDKFYKAIEAAAATLEEFTEKQHFLNTVYERFFQGTPLIGRFRLRVSARYVPAAYLPASGCRRLTLKNNGDAAVSTVSRETLVVNFRELFSLPIGYLRAHAASFSSRWRLQSPFLEHFSQAFARFFMRVGLPSPVAPLAD